MTTREMTNVIEKTVSLKEFCKGRTQSEVAEILGRTQGAVFQMLRDKRHVFITSHLDGTFTAYEIKKFEQKAQA
jgi:predicted transcriptional regulator